MTSVWSILWRYTPLLLLALAWEIVTSTHLVSPNVQTISPITPSSRTCEAPPALSRPSL